LEHSAQVSCSDAVLIVSEADLEGSDFRPVTVAFTVFLPRKKQSVSFEFAENLFDAPKRKSGRIAATRA